VSHDDSDVNIVRGSGAQEGRYANYFQIGFNAHEFVLEFGQGEGAVLIHTKLYLAPAHAQAFSSALLQSLDQFEREFRVE
jgi:hypothetical protein